ncbi:protein inscuteable homolog isoform X2 [Palaemon carinicauda]|uniref:protein inscuteable homolog isoform X2 n=1 Tax=Palaemon carinicauda TaxID=392227 RepID=UPI0035B61872
MMVHLHEAMASLSVMKPSHNLKEEPPLQQHFKRGGSRVYYASENGCWPANSLPKDFWSRPHVQKEPVIYEIGEEALSSGEEAPEGEASGEFFRGSLRGSPSQRSQDSGYSDSGESTNAHNDGDQSSPSSSLPNVKHITRIYFGESPHLFNDKIVTMPKNVTLNNTVPDISQDPGISSLPEVCQVEANIKAVQRVRMASLEELAEELEHKSVLDAVTTKRTGAIRKRSTTSAGTSNSRRPQRRSSSVEKISSEAQSENPRRQAANTRSRRRWSIGDIQPQSHKSRRQSHMDVVHVIADDDIKASGVEQRWPPCIAKEHREQPSAIAKEMRNDSLQQWLKELHVLYEAECMNTLQSKSLPGECIDMPNHSATRQAVRAIQRRAHTVSTEFARLCQRLEWLELSQVPALSESLVGHIQTFLRDYTTQWTAADPDLQPQSSLGRQSRVIQQICDRLLEVCSYDRANNNNDLKNNASKYDQDPDGEITRQVVQVVTALGHAFTKLVDLMLSREIKVVIRAVEEPIGKSEAMSAVILMTTLGIDGGHICRLIAVLGGVRALLGLCLEPRLRCVRVDALRALATVCCMVEGIIELDRAGGIEVVAEILCDPTCPEEERSEAAGVLAQVTSPWVENNHKIITLYEHIDAIIVALTGLAGSTKTPEIFLLASAALANLTFLDGGCVEAMKSAGTARALLRAAKTNLATSIFTKDQIATVLANLCGSRETAEDVVGHGGVAVLLNLLNTRPPPSHRLPEVTTAERVQQKAAIALSRLCVSRTVARCVVANGGAERLVRLCKDEHERNQSDAVLVACLAALRKMASSLGLEELREVDAAELVEPRLLDSFLIYSSRQESFV